MVGNSGAIWIWAGGLTLSRSQTSFQNSISALYSYRSVQPAPGPLCARCTHEPVLRFIVWAQRVQRCSEQHSRYNIQLSDRTAEAGCDEWQSRIRMEQSVDAMSLSMFNSSFLFLYYAYPIILNDRLCRIYLFFLCCTFHCVNSKMLNEFSVLTSRIK